eukprot:m.52298 g.52298  ORF g.52298 m.52298 type:complete len:547 (-) comp12279_c0_seq1:100-1740(-)
MKGKGRYTRLTTAPHHDDESAPSEQASDNGRGHDMSEQQEVRSPPPLSVSLNRLATLKGGGGRGRGGGPLRGVFGGDSSVARWGRSRSDYNFGGGGSFRAAYMRRRGTWEAVTITLLFLSWAACYFTRNHVYVTSTQIKHDENITKAQYGSMMSAGFGAYVLGKVVFSPIADRVGGKPLLLFTMFGSGAVSYVFTLGQTFAWFMTFNFVLRLVQSCGWIGVIKVARAWIAPSRRGRVMGLLALSFLVGDIVSRAALSALIGEGFDWQHVFWVAAAITSAFGVPALLIIKPSPGDMGFFDDDLVDDSNDEDDGDWTVVADRNRRGVWSQFKALLADPQYWCLMYLAFATVAIRETFNIYSSEYLQSAGASKGKAGELSTGYSLAGIPATLLTGWLVDRLPVGRRALVFPTFMVCMVAALGLLAVHDQPNLMVATAMLALSGFFSIGAYTLYNIFLLKFSSSENIALVSGSLDGTGCIGAVVVLALSGVASFRVLFGLLTLLGAGGVVVSGMLSRRLVAQEMRLQAASASSDPTAGPDVESVPMQRFN